MLLLLLLLLLLLPLTNNHWQKAWNAGDNVKYLIMHMNATYVFTHASSEHMYFQQKR